MTGKKSVKKLDTQKKTAGKTLIENEMSWFKVPQKVYFKRGAIDLALRELQGKKRAFIVTDRYLFNSGKVNNVVDILDEIGIDYQIFFDIKPDPTLATINQALEIVRPYEPDIIIALGGGSPIDAAKIIWLLYEQPDTVFEDITIKFMDIRKNINVIPKLGEKATLIAIPTTSGAGSEVTPLAIITDTITQTKYAIADYALTPNMAIIDPNFVDTMSKGLTAASGINALVHATEAYVSALATNFTNSNALEAVKLIFRYLERSWREGANDPIAREKMHYAATIAGMALANSFLGLCHSMAHKLVGKFNMPHGIANALLFRQVIKFNTTDNKQCPAYKPDKIRKKYAQIANELGLKGNTEKEKIELYIQAIDKLMKSINLPNSIGDFGVSKKDFYAKLDGMVDLVYNDQNTKAKHISKEDIKAIYEDAYTGIVRDYK